MQLKGLVRFFTILLILYSIYELSFTWVVRSHEKKIDARATQWVSRNAPTADAATKERLHDSVYAQYLRDTKDETVHYGPTGSISYDKAKKEELNLGLDLKGGMNVTMQVELSGLVRSMANNSKDPIFLKALENANVRKANSGADYIRLFIEEYKKLNPSGNLAALFAATNEKIEIGDSDSQVESELRKAAYDAFDNTYRVLRTRIDQFGVAQPNINPDRERDIITVELPGVQDKERVRNYLQSTANLQFWEVYKDQEELATAWMATEQTYNSLVTNQDTANKDSANKAITRSFNKEFFREEMNMRGVAIKDTVVFRSWIEHPAIRRNFPSDAKFFFGVPPRDKSDKQGKIVPVYVIKTRGSEKPPMEGDVIKTANQGYDQFGTKPNVNMDMSLDGARKWEKLTTTSFNEKRPIAVVLDDIVYSAPIAHNGPITGGRTEITGQFTLQEAQDLANILKSGRLPAPAKIVAEQVVGPTLGEKAIRGGIMAFAISFIVIFLLMLVYYNTSGWIANIALILNLLFTIGVLTGLGATLTAPGIAGLVLTIGMAVDTNVIIYERIKEELTNGKGYIPAINEGYKRSLPPVLDGHITTLLTAVILFSFGLGPVKGFATTQIIGILLSLFCGILVSRWVTEWFTNKNRHLEYFTPLSKKLFKHASYKFIEYRKVAYVISFVVLGLGIAAIFNGFDQGVEFKGGRSYTVAFGKDVRSSIEPIRKDLTAAFGEAPTIKTLGGNDRLDITTTYKIEAQGQNVNEEVQAKLYEGLRSHLPTGTSQEQFTAKNVVGTQTV